MQITATASRCKISLSLPISPCTISNWDLVDTCQLAIVMILKVVNRGKSGCVLTGLVCGANGSTFRSQPNFVFGPINWEWTSNKDSMIVSMKVDTCVGIFWSCKVCGILKHCLIHENIQWSFNKETTMIWGKSNCGNQCHHLQNWSELTFETGSLLSFCFIQNVSEHIQNHME